MVFRIRIVFPLHPESFFPSFVIYPLSPPLTKKKRQRISIRAIPIQCCCPSWLLYRPAVLGEVNTKTEEILYQNISLSPRPPPKIVLKDAWQVQREDNHQRGTSTEKCAADEGKMEPRIDCSTREREYSVWIGGSTVSFLIIFSRRGCRRACTMNLASPSSTVAFVFELTVLAGHISEQQFV